MKLVLIDDEPFHLIGMQTVIPWEQSQFIIAGEARSGEEGIELILREQPDIAIVDIVMPGIDGLEMIRRVKDAAPETRFIVLSCMNDIQRYKEAVSLGAAEYLQKDLATPDVLLETVRRVAQQLKRERLRNSDGEAHADTAPQLRTEYLNLLLSGTAENLRTAPYQLEKWGLLKRGAPFTVGLLTVQMPDTGSQRAQPPYAGIIAIAQEIFCREGSSCFFRTAGRNIAALLPALSPERMEKAFSRLQSMAESSIDCILSMGISETANDARQIPALYEHAHQACASAYYDGHGKLYRFSASPARHTAGRPAYKRTNTFSAAALHAELDALTVHLKNARPQLPQAAAQLTAFIQRTILLAEQTGIIAGADEVSGDEIAKSCASAVELSLAAAGIHRLIDVLDAPEPVTAGYPAAADHRICTDASVRQNPAGRYCAGGLYEPLLCQPFFQAGDRHESERVYPSTENRKGKAAAPAVPGRRGERAAWLHLRQPLRFNFQRGNRPYALPLQAAEPAGRTGNAVENRRSSAAAIFCSKKSLFLQRGTAGGRLNKKTIFYARSCMLFRRCFH